MTVSLPQRMLRAVLLPAFILISACADAPPAPVPPISTGFTCTAVGTYRQLEVSCDIRRLSKGLMTLEMTAPESVAGLCFSWDIDTIHITLDGIYLPVEPSELPTLGFAVSILDAFDVMTSSPVPAGTVDGQSCTREYTGAGGRLILRSDPESGAPLSLSIPAAGMTVAFTDFQLLALTSAPYPRAPAPTNPTNQPTGAV